MARVQYSHPTSGINETKPMFAPMKSGLEPWLRAIRKVFPEAPKGYYLAEQLITEQSIMLKYECPKTHDRFAFVVAR